jgi:MFS superfamily sulfate permease-like transporter
LTTLALVLLVLGLVGVFIDLVPLSALSAVIYHPTSKF